MIIDAALHLEYARENAPLPETPAVLRSELAERLARLQRCMANRPQDARLNQEENEWLARSYPVLSIVAPVMATSEEKIEFPGDPMCLYSALSYAIQQVVETREKGFTPESAYNDLCPQWGYTPSKAYRATSR